MSEPIDPDFASLLEREPQPERMGEREKCAHELEEYGYPNAARILRSGPDSLDERLKTENVTNALDSAASRIKELEGVLVAVRAGLGAFRLCAHWRDAEKLTSLINETLDPCKPWCVLEPGHGGACASDMEFCEDRDE